jgi:hypothetical protein
MSKAEYMDFFARSEAARAEFASRNGNGGGGMGGPGRGMGGPGNWDPNGMGRQGNWDPNMGNWDPSMGGRPPFEKKEVEEEKPIAGAVYFKDKSPTAFPKVFREALPSWYEEFDTDKDAQVSLYEWRKSGKETKEFTEIDLNGDGLITVEEYLRYARLKNIQTKVTAYEASGGTDRPDNWGLVDAKDGKNGKGGPGGPGNKGGGPGGPGGKGGGPGGPGGPGKGPRPDSNDTKTGSDDPVDPKADRGKGKNRWNQ